jgi:cytochrome c
VHSRRAALAMPSALLLASGHALAQSAVQRGAQVFQVCTPCHSLQPGVNMSGPSLAGVWGRKAGTLAGFDRYSPALKASGVTWDAKTLDPWLKNPAQFIPGNWMTFRGIPNATTRADLISFLKQASAGEVPAAAGPGGMAPQFTDLKKVGPGSQVRAIRSCRGSYFVTTADGKTRAYWDHSLRFETDASALGPPSGTPVILPAGMMGDRATVVFAKPDEISPFVTAKC